MRCRRRPRARAPPAVPWGVMVFPPVFGAAADASASASSKACATASLAALPLLTSTTFAVSCTAHAAAGGVGGGGGGGLADPADNITSSNTLDSTISAAEAASDADGSWFMTPVFDSVQSCLETVHHATGLPWYLTIVLSTLAVRSSFLPLIVHQLKAGGRYATAAKPEADKLWHLYKEARDRSTKANNVSGLARATSLYWRGLRAVLAKHNCRPVSLFGGSLVQLPAFLTFVVSMRHMIRDGGLRSDLAHGGALWFNDLTLPDETLALPVLAIGMTYANLQMSLGKAPPGTVFHWLKDTGQVLLIAGLPLTTALPQGIFLYWITNAAFSAVQTHAVRADGVRSVLGLPPMGAGGDARSGSSHGGGMPVPRSDWIESKGKAD